jgi:hypothetical protein
MSGIFLTERGLEIMKILRISTYDISGGAARAAYRLQKGLHKISHDCRMLVKHKNTEDPYVYKISSELGRRSAFAGFFPQQGDSGTLHPKAPNGKEQQYVFSSLSRLRPYRGVGSQ